MVIPLAPTEAAIPNGATGAPLAGP